MITCSCGRPAFRVFNFFKIYSCLVFECCVQNIVQMMIPTPYSVICLNILLFLSSSSSVLSNPLKIFVHIGPHKTGSTHIQTYLEENWQSLEKENICIPSSIHSAKNFASLADSFAYYPADNIPELPEFKEIQNCLQKKMNVVISTENFSGLQADKVATLKNWLEKAAQGQEVEVKIVLYYREWLNYMYSLYFEMQKQFQNTGVTTFSEFFTMNNVTADVYSYEFKAQNYIKTFGEDSMIIVDYYGVETAHKDIAYVFVCDVMGVYCSKANELHTGKAGQENPHFNMVYLHYLYLLDIYLNTHFLRRCVLDTNFLYWEVAGLTARKIEFPTKVSHFEFYRELAVENDKSFQEKYKKRFLYGNHEVNVQRINNFHVEEIDVVAFYRDPQWELFMGEETIRYIKQGIICALGDGQVKIGTEDLGKLKVHQHHRPIGEQKSQQSSVSL
jgi:hypothetical protein